MNKTFQTTNTDFTLSEIRLLSAIEELLDRKLDEKLEQKLDEKLEQKLDEKLTPRFADMEKRLDIKLDHLEKKFDTKLDNLEKKFDSKLDDLEKKFDSKLDDLEKKFDSKLDRLEEKVDAHYEEHSRQIREINLLLENEFRPNISIIAEGHLDLNHKLDQALQLMEESQRKWETLSLKVNYHDAQLRCILQ